MFWTQPTYANGGPICEGDWIKTFMPRSLVWHHGIVRSVAFISPEIVGLYVVHNMKATGITTTELFGFCEAQPVLLHARPNSAHVPAILARADRSIGKPYHLFAQNCEHFASFAFNGKAESKTVKGVGVAVLGALVVAGILNS